MKVFLCGGGAGEQTIEANKRLNEVIDHTKPCLYIPLAMEADMYDSCYKWITGELKDLEIPHIDMVRSAEELAEKDLSAYSVLFIGGGNIRDHVPLGRGVFGEWRCGLRRKCGCYYFWRGFGILSVG